MLSDMCEHDAQGTQNMIMSDSVEPLDVNST